MCCLNNKPLTTKIPMPRILLVILLHIGLILNFAVGCAPDAMAPTTPTPRSGITDYASLVAALRAQGIPAEPGEEILNPVFTVKQRMLTLPRARVAVLEYPGEQDAKAQASKISPDGVEIGNATVDWADVPHFYRTNRLIVFYIGRDEATLDALERVLGPQFAGAPRDAPTPTIEYEPTAAPYPPESPAPTKVIDPRTPTVVPWDLAQATIAARATAHPFPTPNAVAIQRDATISATARRDGITFRIEIPKDTFVAGEGAHAQLTLSNDGQETVFVGIGHDLAQVFLMDEQEHAAPPFPWYEPSMPGPPYLGELAPGKVISATVNFHVPLPDASFNHAYALWALTQFSRRAPENGNYADNLWLHLETGPIPLHIEPPKPSQQLTAKLEADRNGWRVKVTDARGEAPNVSMWGMLETSSYNSFSGRPLRENVQGEWSGAWQDNFQGEEVSVRVWVSAPGYTTAIAYVVVPGIKAGRTMFDIPQPLRQVFSSLDAAQAAVNLPLFQVQSLPTDALLDHVEVDDSTYDHQRRTFIYQLYRLAGNKWFELTQMNWTERFASAGWGSARYAPEAQQVSVAGAPGYLVRELDWWVLDWKRGDVGFELHAPVAAFSRDELLKLAASVQP